MHIAIIACMDLLSAIDCDIGSRVPLVVIKLVGWVDAKSHLPIVFVVALC